MPNTPKIDWAERHEQVVIRVRDQWHPDRQWYRDARVHDECLNPDTSQRVEGCHCNLCGSRLTDPSVVGRAK